MYKKRKFNHVLAEYKEKEQIVGEYKVSTLGYQSTAEKIKAMTLAGVNLALIRNENYQGDVGEVENVDIERTREFDLVDAEKILTRKKQDLERYKARLDAEQKARVEEKKKYYEELEMKYKELEKKNKKPTDE